MIAAGLVCWALLSVLPFGSGNRPALALGMIGPVAAAVSSWMLVARVHQRAPETVSALMIKLFGAKMVFFGAYVSAVVLLSSGDVVAFVVSFTSHYILLHLLEAWHLRRLFSSDGRALER